MRVGHCQAPIGKTGLFIQAGFFLAVAGSDQVTHDGCAAFAFLLRKNRKGAPPVLPGAKKGSPPLIAANNSNGLLYDKRILKLLPKMLRQELLGQFITFVGEDNRFLLSNRIEYPSLFI